MKANLNAPGMRATFLAALLLMGCASTEAPAPTGLHPQTLSELRRTVAAPGKRPTVALVLGGGGLRGFAHVGALQALEEAGVRPDIVVGTSAGSVVGAAYASGLSVEKIRQAALDVKVSSLLDFTWQSGGFIRGDNLASWVNTVIGDTRIENFPIRFAAVATDLQSGQPLLLAHGYAGRAIQASSAVPGVQLPVSYAGGSLVDGGVTSLVPVRFARAMGADVVIAVDIYCQSLRTAALTVPSVLGKVMHTQSCLIAAPEMAEADVLVAPVVDVPSMSDRASQVMAMDVGYRATRRALANWRSTAADPLCSPTPASACQASKGHEDHSGSRMSSSAAGD